MSVKINSCQFVFELNRTSVSSSQIFVIQSLSNYRNDTNFTDSWINRRSIQTNPYDLSFFHQHSRTIFRNTCENEIKSSNVRCMGNKNYPQKSPGKFSVPPFPVELSHPRYSTLLGQYFDQPV